MKRTLPGALLACALCATAAAFAQPAAQPVAPAPILVGAVAPQTGILADLAADLRKSLELWREEVNAAGGLLGRRVELRLLDDRSESADNRKLYEQLIREDKVDLLVGPFGSAASLGAAAVAERARRVLVNATGASRAVHRSGFRYVFQAATPLGAWGTGAMEFARAQGAQRAIVLAREDPSAREMAARAREDAAALGIAAGEVEVYAQGTEDFLPQVSRARATGADAWIAFGLPQDAAEMVKALRKSGFAPRLFVAQGVVDPVFLTRVGQDGEYAAGLLAYDHRARTPGNLAFAQAYAKKWSADPGLLAAEGYAAAKLLELAVRRAGTLEQEKLREALAAMEGETPLGAYKVDRDGIQRAARVLVLQIQRGRREIVWPEALATAKWQPLPAWSARKILK
jgi:branched-chain amino acid transport system substrate-binding protein